MIKPFILIIDDEEYIVESLTIQLKNNFKTKGVTSIKEAELILKNEKPDIIILDRILNNESGDTFCEYLKNNEETKDIYIILLSCLIKENKIIEGLDELKADDYIKKPFSPREVESRINAIIRRNLPEKIIYNNITIDRANFSFLVNNRAIDLTAHEFKLIYKLLIRPKQIFTFSILQYSVWNNDVSKQALQKCVSRINQKVSFSIIESIRNIGYRIRQ